MINNLLTILRKISEIIASHEEHGNVMQQIVKVLAESLNVEVCSVYVYDEKSHQLILQATVGLNEQAIGKIKMKAGEGLTGESFKQNKILNISDPAKHPRFKFFKKAGEEGLKSFLAVPLTTAGRCVGVLIFQSTKQDRYPHSVVDMVKTLSTQLANLILNARMLNILNEQGHRQDVTPRVLKRTQLMLRGIAANDGIAQGVALIFKTQQTFDNIPHGTCSDIEQELTLLNEAIIRTKMQTIELEKRALALISEIDASIFNVHLMILEDRAFMDEIRQEIKKQGHTIEFSIKQIFQKYHALFMKMNDPIFREKEMDMKDVLLRLIESVQELRGGKSKGSGSKRKRKVPRSVLFAEELLPSDLIRMPIDHIAGIVCEKGGVTAHIAILAKALDIPALMGVKDLLQHINHNDEIILDCHAELFYANPSDAVRQHYHEMTENELSKTPLAEPGPAITLDQKPIILRGNISLICETSLLSQYGAQGVGLYRTEFLYMVRDSLPTEEAQYNVFSKIIKEAAGELVTIRVLDSGGDKPLPYLHFSREDNPALGNRGIRLLLGHEEIFRTQLKAILRAGALGPIRLLFPMVCNLQEIYQIRQHLTEVEMELHAQAIDHAEHYPIGIMIEIPATIFALEQIFHEVDYVSIGSNDLLQYSFAVDRGNEQVSRLYQPLHPVFLRMLKQIGDIAKKFPDKGLSLCGEMAADPHCLPFLLGAGIYELSMAPRQIPQVKKIIRQFSLAECQALLNEAITMMNPEAVSYLVKERIADKATLALNDSLQFVT